MENKIDQFFKEKLEEHTLPLSEEAWVKVEANLSKKNNIAIWRIAAAILIMGALVSAIFWSQRDHKNNEQILATKKPNKGLIKEKPSQLIFSTEKNEQVKSNNKKSSIALPQPASSKSENKLDENTVEENEMIPTKVDETKEHTVAVVKESIQNEKIKTEATSPATIASTKRKPIKLEFTLDDFSSEQPVATVNEEKNTGLKKVWEMAIEVKNGNGRVREIKNEIFALNFKKNKNQ